MLFLLGQFKPVYLCCVFYSRPTPPQLWAIPGPKQIDTKQTAHVTRLSPVLCTHKLTDHSLVMHQGRKTTTPPLYTQHRVENAHGGKPWWSERGGVCTPLPWCINTRHDRSVSLGEEMCNDHPLTSSSSPMQTKRFQGHWRWNNPKKVQGGYGTWCSVIFVVVLVVIQPKMYIWDVPNVAHLPPCLSKLAKLKLQG